MALPFEIDMALPFVPAYNEPQEYCPHCGSDNIANEDAQEHGWLPVTCHDCSFQWIESSGN